MTLIDKLTRSPLSRGFILFLFYVTALGIFFRIDFISHFTLAMNDQYDGIIEIALQEHWYNVARGLESWNTGAFFYPHTDTIGYNDGYFLYGLIYSGFRGLGTDPFLAADLVSMTIKSVGFFSCYFVARNILKIDFIFAAFAALTFTISNNSYAQAVHAQLYSVALAPLEIILIQKFLVELNSRQFLKTILWGICAIAFYAAWLITAYYMAWFFAYLLIIFILVYLSRHKIGFTAIKNVLRENYLALLILTIFGLISLTPFIMLYAPKVLETSSSHSASWSPALLDIVNVGYKNVLFGSTFEFLDRYFKPNINIFNYSEFTTGITPILLTTFFASIVVIRRKLDESIYDLLYCASLAIIISWLLTIHFNGWHHRGKIVRIGLWKYVHDFFPGAVAIRSISRYQIFLALPITLFAFSILARWRSHLFIALIICCLIVVEQLNLETLQPLSRDQRTDWLNAISSPPAICPFFYASAARDGPNTSNKLYSHNVDAMLIAEYIHLPTINGFATYNPSDWNFSDTTAPDYRDRVSAYAEAHHLQNLCALNLETLQWN